MDEWLPPQDAALLKWRIEKARQLDWRAEVRGDGRSRTAVRKAFIVGTTCLVCLLFNYLRLRQTGFSCSWSDTVSRFTLRQGSLASLLV